MDDAFLVRGSKRVGQRQPFAQPALLIIRRSAARSETRPLVENMRIELEKNVGTGVTKALLLPEQTPGDMRKAELIRHRLDCRSA